MQNDYADYIFEYQGVPERSIAQESPECIKIVNERFGVAYVRRREGVPTDITEAGGYDYIPKLYTLTDTSSMEASNISGGPAEPLLGLQGNDILIGLVDTGIDFDNNVFKDELGNTRIAAIWDQTDQTGTSPAGLDYGSEYRSDVINAALASENPREIVPSVDENGHGTFMAGIAAGSYDPQNDFYGAASKARIAMVKLKPTKQYLKDYFFTREDALAYQENDIMLGVSYLINLHNELDLPLVICLCVGTNYGDHTGNNPLGSYLGMISFGINTVVVTSTGNEANKSLHYLGQMDPVSRMTSVEVRVPPNSSGFTLELWCTIPERYTVGFVSPTGDVVPQVPDRVGTNGVLDFIFEETKIYIDYWIVEPRSGGQLVFMRFEKPTPGIWTVRVYNLEFIDGVFNIWLPQSDLLTEGTVFLQPNPTITAMTPSTQRRVVSVGAYNHRNNTIYDASGRGFARTGIIVPDIVGPGVDVYGPAPGNQYVTRTGASIGTAHVAGASACMMEWAFYQQGMSRFNTDDVRTAMIRGARRNPDLFYPNREWGYGALDLRGIFTALH